MFSKHIYLLVILFLAASVNLSASTSQTLGNSSHGALPGFEKQEINPNELNTSVAHKIRLITKLQEATVENKKITAAILTLTLGMLGVHRIYLGTAPYIPAVYLFTFGGGFFILPIIDLVMILTTNDLSKFENNKRLLMWTGE